VVGGRLNCLGKLDVKRRRDLEGSTVPVWIGAVLKSAVTTKFRSKAKGLSARDCPSWVSGRLPSPFL
jgi:hypothetical protein